MGTNTIYSDKELRSLARRELKTRECSDCNTRLRLKRFDIVITANTVSLYAVGRCPNHPYIAHIAVAI